MSWWAFLKTFTICVVVFLAYAWAVEAILPSPVGM